MHLKAIPRQSTYHSLDEIAIYLKLLFKRNYAHGDYIKKFEKEMSKYLGIKNVISVSSARLALYLILKELNFEKGSEIIVPSYTFHIVPNIVQMVGLRPIFVDCKKDSDNINIDGIKEAITRKTKAIIPTSILGNPCDIKSIVSIAKENDLRVIEDCAHSLGSEIDGKKDGTFGDISYFSFGTGKNMDCFGGGIICTDNDKLAENIRSKAKKLKYPPFFKILKKVLWSYTAFFLSLPAIFTFFVYPLLFITQLFNLDVAHRILKEEEKLLKNFPEKDLIKFSNIQAAIGVIQLKKLDYINDLKIKNAQMLIEGLKKLNFLSVSKTKKNVKNIYLLCYFRSELRDFIRKKMILKGIDTKAEYQFVCSEMPIFKEFYKDCPNARKIKETEFNLPNSVFMKKKDILRIINIIKRINGNLKKD